MADSTHLYRVEYCSWPESVRNFPADSPLAAAGQFHRSWVETELDLERVALVGPWVDGEGCYVWVICPGHDYQRPLLFVTELCGVEPNLVEGGE